MPGKVLLVAFHFPPAAMGSGHLRTLGFARHLPTFGWEPVVLTAHTIAYPHVNMANNGLIPDGCVVSRSLALDAKRHLGVAGKYPSVLAIPDRWSSWWLPAVWQGMRLIHRERISVVWSTYPIMTAHCVARAISKLSKLPWVADFRDPVDASARGRSPIVSSACARGERSVLKHANRVVLATPRASRSYAERFPFADALGRLCVIPNGYEESTFSRVSASAVPPHVPNSPLRLVHSGLLYREGRNPVPFLMALAEIRDAGGFAPNDLQVILRGSGSESIYASEIHRLRLDGIVQLAPTVSNREALVEQASADALLLFQGRRFDRQIPAKAYEYLRIQKPIFALVSVTGDTADLMYETNAAAIAPIDDTPAIRREMQKFLESLRAGNAKVVGKDVVQRYSRLRGAAKLAALLDCVQTEATVRASRG